MVKQLSLNDLPGVDVTARPRELQETIDRNRKQVEIQTELMRGGDEPPTTRDADWWEDVFTRAVLRINRAQRELEAKGSDITIVVHAQDWLCLELPEWCHDILREW